MAYTDIPKALRDQLEADKKTITDDLSVKQARYLRKYGRYWQGIATHDTPPSDGVATRANYRRVAGSNAKPTSPEVFAERQIGGSWDEFLTASKASDLGVSIACDEYVGTRGAGYVIRTELIQDDNRYVKLENNGPETYREQDWTLVLDEE